MKIERRNFLKNTAAIVGGSAFLGSLPWLQSVVNAQQTESKSGKVRLAIVGTGSRGRLLLELLLRIPTAEVVALCDNYAPSIEAARKLSVQGNPRLYTEYTELLSDAGVDAIVVATPLYLHHQMTVKALEAGKYVFCEKAMAKTSEDCLDMVNVSKQTGKGLMIGHQRMFDPQYLEGIGRIHGGDIGKLTQLRAFWHRNNDWRRPVPESGLERHINWRLYNEYSLGLMTELASHQIHVANWVLGSHPLKVTGMGSINFWSDGREVFDNVNLVYQYPGGVHFVYDSLISNQHYGCEEQVMGSLGTLELESGRFYPETPPPAPGILQLIHTIEKGVFEAIPIGGASWVPESASSDKAQSFVPEGRIDDGTTLQMEAFVNMVAEQSPQPDLLEKAYYASIATIMGYQAMVSGQPVDFDSRFVL